MKFLSYHERQSVWMKRKALQGSRVWLKEDYPPEIEKRRRILHPYLRSAQEGDPANPSGRVSAFMRLDKLIINNQTFSCESLDKIPAYVKYRVENPPSMKQTDNVTIFFTSGSPLSNFYPAEFSVWNF